MRKCKRIVPDRRVVPSGKYCIYLPIYSEYLSRPAIRIEVSGTLEEMKDIFESLPDYLKESAEESRKTRECIIKDYIFCINDLHWNIEKFKKNRPSYLIDKVLKEVQK